MKTIHEKKIKKMMPTLVFRGSKMGQNFIL